MCRHHKKCSIYLSTDDLMGTLCYGFACLLSVGAGGVVFGLGLMEFSRLALPFIHVHYTQRMITVRGSICNYKCHHLKNVAAWSSR